MTDEIKTKCKDFNRGRGWLSDESGENPYALQSGAMQCSATETERDRPQFFVCLFFFDFAEPADDAGG